MNREQKMYIYRMEYYSDLKEKEIMKFAGWMELVTIIVRW